jgi:hypothetical protein
VKNGQKFSRSSLPFDPSSRVLLLKFSRSVHYRSATAPLVPPSREIAGSNAALSSTLKVLSLTHALWRGPFHVGFIFDAGGTPQKWDSNCFTTVSKCIPKGNLTAGFTVYAFQKTAIGAHEDTDMATGLGYGRLIVGIKPGIGHGCSAHNA